METQAPTPQDVVNTPSPTPAEEPKETKTAEDVVEANKTEALRQAREKAKAVEAELAEYKKKEETEREKEMKKKGEHEKLLTEKDARLAELESKLAELEPIKSKFEERMSKEITELSSKIPEGKKEFVNKLIEGKSHDQQVEILTELSKEFGSYNPNTPTGKVEKPAEAFTDSKSALTSLVKDMFSL